MERYSINYFTEGEKINKILMIVFFFFLDFNVEIIESRSVDFLSGFVENNSLNEFLFLILIRELN